MNLKQRLTVGLIDILMIVELCVSLALASRDPQLFTLLFCKSFFAMLLPTLLCGGLAVRYMRSRAEESEA